MAFWRKWTEEVWFAPREEDNGIVQQSVQPKKKKKTKKVKQEDYSGPSYDTDPSQKSKKKI